MMHHPSWSAMPPKHTGHIGTKQENLFSKILNLKKAHLSVRSLGEKDVISEKENVLPIHLQLTINNGGY
jgi:hypothetical protein